MRLKILAAAALAAVVAGCTTMPEQPEAKKTVWLDQNWTNDQRFWYHHESQGTSTFPIPYKWFVSLEQPKLFPGTKGLFAESAYLETFGFIPSPKTIDGAGAKAYGYGPWSNGKGVPVSWGDEKGSNPDGLPVGFARTPGYVDPATGKQVPDQIGLTCAACHTGHMTYNGTDVRIDGAPAMTDLTTLSIALVEAIGATAIDPLRFDRFAERVLGVNYTDAQKKELKAQLDAVIVGSIAELKTMMAHSEGSVPEGFGRLDALNRIGNQVFYADLNEAKGFPKEANIAATNAPVNYPHIWNTSWFDWVQYDASIMEPMVRNAGEALGVAANVNLVTPGDTLYGSAVPVENLYQMEGLLAGTDPLRQPKPGFNGLRSPRWPGEIFPAVDTDLAEEGKALYVELCQGCHLPPVNDPDSDLWKAENLDKYWWPANSVPKAGGSGETNPWNTNGERYLKLPQIPVAEIGTDPAQATVLTVRQVEVPCYLGLDEAQCAGKKDDDWIAMPFATALGGVVQNTVKKWYDDNGTPAEDRLAMNGWRPNELQALMVYRTRPLDGIWATAPFLHNGSVPTVYDLLSPLEERPKTVCLGYREFDPKKLGFVNKCEKGTTRIDTTVAGNLNTGHEFRDGPTGNGVIGRALSEEERYALIEYLKTL